VETVFPMPVGAAQNNLPQPAMVRYTAPAISYCPGRQAGPVTFAAVNYHREIPMGDTVELLYAPSEEGWYVQGRHDGRTSFECYLEIGS